MEASALPFFFIFVLIVVGMYIAIRRRIAPSGVVAALGILGSVIAMMFFSLAQGNVVAQAIVVGLLVGGAFSIAALAMAWYFQGNEMREEFRKQKSSQAEQG